MVFTYEILHRGRRRRGNRKGTETDPINLDSLRVSRIPVVFAGENAGKGFAPRTNSYRRASCFPDRERWFVTSIYLFRRISPVGGECALLFVLSSPYLVGKVNVNT